jgi:hypothetical protein
MWIVDLIDTVGEKKMQGKKLVTMSLKRIARLRKLTWWWVAQLKNFYCIRKE